MDKIQNKKIPITIFLFAIFSILIVNVLEETIYIPNITTVQYVQDGTVYETPTNIISKKLIKGKTVGKYKYPDTIEYTYSYVYEDVGVSFFGIDFKSKNLQVLFILCIALSVYLFLFKTDSEINNDLNRYKLKVLQKTETIRSNKISKATVIALSFLAFIVLIVVLLVVYYYSLLEKEQLHVPLNYFESFVLGFGATFFKVLLVIIGFSVLKSIFSKK